MKVILGVVAALVLSGCAGADPAESTGTASYDLHGTSSSGQQYRLGLARIRITGPESATLQIDENSPPEVRLDLAPGDYVSRLGDDWRLEALTDGAWTEVDAKLVSAPEVPFTISAGEHTDVRYTFGVGPEFIAFGDGQAVFGIDVLEPPEEPPPSGLISFGFTGVVSSVFPERNDVKAGDPMTATFTFDSSIVPSFEEPGRAEYRFDPLPEEFSFQMQAGTLELDSQELNPGEPNGVVDVFDDRRATPEAQPEDRFGFVGRELVSAAVPTGVGTVLLELKSRENLNAVTSTALPVVAPDLDAFEQRSFFLSVLTSDPFVPSVSVTGTLTAVTLVP